jgi:negative regulator of PHO system
VCRDLRLYSKPEIKLGEKFPRYPKVPFSRLIPQAPPAGTSSFNPCYSLVLTTLTSTALDLLERLLQFDPQKRLTAAEALTHPYFTSTSNIYRQAPNLAYPNPLASYSLPTPYDPTAYSQYQAAQQQAQILQQQMAAQHQYLSAQAQQQAQGHGGYGGHGHSAHGSR